MPISRAHIDSRLGLKGISNSTDKNTAFLAHYDISLNDINGTKPFGSNIDDNTILSYTMSSIKNNDVGTFIIDKGMSSNHAQVFGPILANGRNGNSMKFNGISDYVETFPVAITEEITISLWIYFETTASHSWILTNRTATANGISIFLLNGTDLCYDFGGANDRWNTGYKPPKNEWLHITLTRNQFIRVLYVNGIEVIGIGSSGNLSTANLNNSLIIGAERNASFFKGSIDSLHIWSKILEPEEIQQIYYDPIYTLYPTSGKFGGAVAIQNSTTNLVNTVSLDALGSVVKEGGWIDFDSTGEYVLEYTPLGYIKVAHNIAWVDVNKDPSYDGGGSIFGAIGNEQINVSPNTTYTVSFHLKVKERDYFNNNFLYLQEYNSSGAQISEVGIANKDNRIYLNNGWYKVFATFTTSPTTVKIQIQHYQYDSLGNEFWFFGPQLEQKPFATSFTEGSRNNGEVIYPVAIDGDFTISFWTKFDCKWYGLQTQYGKKFIEFYNSISKAKVTWTDYTNVLNNGNAYFNLEPDVYWDEKIHHWHQRFDYETNTWYYIVFVKSENTLRQIIYDYSSGEKIVDTSFTYTDSAKFANYSFDQLIIYGDWSAFIDELRIDKRAVDEEEILAWYLSDVPFHPRGIERSVY